MTFKRPDPPDKAQVDYLLHRLRTIEKRRKELGDLEAERVAAWRKLREFSPPVSYATMAQYSGMASAEAVRQSLDRYDARLERERERRAKTPEPQPAPAPPPPPVEALVCSQCREPFDIPDDSQAMWEAVWAHREASPKCGEVNAMPKVVKVPA